LEEEDWKFKIFKNKLDAVVGWTVETSYFGYLACCNIITVENQGTAPEVSRKDTTYNVTLRNVLTIIVTMEKQ
jgi:hypothetical protein